MRKRGNKLGEIKGIILAGGSGTRLSPLTKIVCKQLLPVYDKPMIYYPLATLMEVGIRDILIISTEKDIIKFKELFDDGSNLGINLKYEIQKNPNGIAEAFLIGEKFIGNDDVALILGDNIFYGKDFSSILKKSLKSKLEGIVFGYKVKNPEQYGVVEFDENKKVISIKEKPIIPKSDYIIPGLYIYDNSVIEKAKKLVPSKRGELEITDISNLYLKEGKLFVKILNDDFVWFDTGTCDSLLEAQNFIKLEQEKIEKYIGCIEEIAYKNNWINKEQIIKLAKQLQNTEYGKYLLKLIEKN